METVSVDGHEVIVELVNFDTTKINEVVLKNDDGTFTVLLNSKFNEEQLREAYEHAVNHIRNNDFEKISVQSIETEAHQQMSAEEVCEHLSKEAAERRHKRFVRRQKKRQQKLAEYEEFWNSLRSDSPNSFDSIQDDMIYRF